MDALIGQVRSLAKTADEAARKKLMDTLQDLSHSLETPQDSMQRIIVSQMRLAADRVGCDLKIFKTLAAANAPLSVQDIAAKTGANPDPLFLARLLRYLASIGDIAETDQDMFAANHVTKALAIDGFEGGIYHYFDSFGPAIQAFPEFMKETNYQNITDNTKTPLQKGQNTDQPAFIWVQSRPELFKHFNQYMAVQRMGMPTWLEFYPYQERAQGLEPDRALFVDVGGGLGHQSIALREALPSVPNKIVLQDLPMTLQHAIKHPGVEIQEHDFYHPQPVKGAKIYYMRNIIHDYPDEKALVILTNTVAALAPDSVILIDDMVVPNKGARWETTQLDMAMMTGLAALERTYDQWHELAAKAGLKIVNMYKYTVSLQDHIIECVRA